MGSRKNGKHSIWKWIGIVLILGMLGACYDSGGSKENTEPASYETTSEESADAKTQTDDEDDVAKLAGNTEQESGGDADTDSNTAEVSDTDTETSMETQTETQTEKITVYTLSDIPTYSGSPYAVLQEDIPDFSNADKERTDAFESYSDLDALGRCGQAYANVCKDLMPTEERGSIGQIKPSGWHTVKYPDVIEDLYLYNRCHLIGYQLTGENANEKNLITGTRYLNVEGMLPFENEVNDYIDQTGNHVLYRATPVYEGDNLVASGVELEAWSVEDQGAGVCFHVYCYNVQPGIGIDYATGDSWEEEGANASGQTEEETVEGHEPKVAAADQTESDDADVSDYIINTNTGKFHTPGCSAVKQMSEANKKEVTSTVDELKAQGYEPCKRCLSGK